MGDIGVVSASAIERALAASPRQYLMGRLKRPQELDHIDSDAVEVGIVDYPVAAADEPHTHVVTSEYQYVLRGQVKLLDLVSREEVSLAAGDFYAVPRDTPHVQKAADGTRVIFFKTPAGDDKQVLDVDASVVRWLADLEF